MAANKMVPPEYLAARGIAGFPADWHHNFSVVMYWLTPHVAVALDTVANSLGRHVGKKGRSIAFTTFSLLVQLVSGYMLVSR